MSRTSCPVCLSTKLDHAEDNLSYCLSCDHWFQSDLNVSIAYDATYMETYDKYPTDTMAMARAGYVLREIANLPADRTPLEPQAYPVLDFGYGNGAFLKVMRKLGYPVFGLDLHGVDYGIPDWKRGHSPAARLLTAFDSIEHVPEFDFFFELNPELAVISTPYRPTWFGEGHRQWRHFKPGEHLHYFSLKSLRTLFDRFGYDLVAWSFPEDALRGKLPHEEKLYDNILTASFQKRQK
jgi:hypothetical protein